MTENKPPLFAPAGLFYVTHLAVVVLSSTTFATSPLRPFLPIAICVALAVWALFAGARRTIAIDNNGVMLLLAYLGVSIFSYLFAALSDSPPSEFLVIRKIGLPASALFVACFRYRIRLKSFTTYISVLFVVSLYFAVRDSSFDSVNLDFGSSDSATESVMGIGYGALAVWLFANERKKLALLAFVCDCFFFKRNSIVASAIVCCSIFVISWMPDYVRGRVVRWCAGVSAAVLLAVSTNMVGVFNWVEQFFPGIPAEQLSTGRVMFWSDIYQSMAGDRGLELLLGHGPGAVEGVVTRSVFGFQHGLTLAHNEYLSMVYDFGIVGAAIVFGMLYRIGRRDNAAMGVVWFLAIIFVIENVLFISASFALISFLLAARLDGAYIKGPGQKAMSADGVAAQTA